jgi:uncharacterized C2H2 Zn-finger protein
MDHLNAKHNALKSMEKNKLKVCPFCDCTFETDHDYTLHMNAFGWKKEEHLQNLIKARRLLNWSYND